MNKKSIIMLVISIVVTILIILSIILFTNNTRKTPDFSKMSTWDIFVYFADNGFQFEYDDMLESSKYVSMTKNNIDFTKFYNTYTRDFITFKDSNINSESCYISKQSDNDTIEELNQFEAYKKWISQYNITTKQIENLLDYYKEHYEDIYINN